MSSRHSEPPAPDGELRRLVAAVCDGLATAAERDQLQSRLLAEPAAVEYYIGYLDLHAELQWRSRGTAMFSGSVDRESGVEALRPLARLRRLLLRPTPFSLTTAALVMGLLITALAFVSPPIYRAVVRRGVAAESTRVAEISRTQGAEWKSRQSDSEGAHWLAVGDQIELVRGLAEIQFYRGARVTLEGPVVLRIAGDNAALLDHGKLVARVSDSAHGFEIRTPAATIRDLGTEFAVAATKQGATDVHVFQGKVEVRAANNSARSAVPYLVDAGERLVVAASGNVARSPSVDGGAQFVRRMPAQSNELRITDEYVQAIRIAAPAIYWRFESARDEHIANEMSRDHVLQVVGAVRLLPTGDENYSAVFGGTKQPHHLICRDANVMSGPQYTVELWCQPYTQSPNVLALFGLASKDVVDSQLLELNNTGVDAAAGGRVRFLHRSVPGSSGGTDLFSAEAVHVGRWHHIVSVYDDGAMRLYVNGQRFESKTTAPLHADARVMLLGALRTTAGDARRFVGRLDEVAVYKRALSDVEIREHWNLVK